MLEGMFICGAATLLLIGGALWVLRSGAAAARANQSKLELEAEELAAQWLARASSCSLQEALTALRGADQTAPLAMRWIEAEARLTLTFERVGPGRYTLLMSLEDTDGVVEARREISLDALPDEVRALMVRGQTHHSMAWRPAFMKREV